MKKFLSILALTAALALGGPADAHHDPDTNLLSGQLQLTLEGIADASPDAAVDAEIERALVVLQTDHQKLSKAAKKIGAALHRLDKVIGDDADYAQRADEFIALFVLTSSQDALAAQQGLVDDILRNPLGRAPKVARAVTKKLTKRDDKLAVTGLTRKKQMKLVFKAQKFWEKVIRKYS